MCNSFRKVYEGRSLLKLNLIYGQQKSHPHARSEVDQNADWSKSTPPPSAKRSSNCRPLSPASRNVSWMKKARCAASARHVKRRTSASIKTARLPPRWRRNVSIILRLRRLNFQMKFKPLIRAPPPPLFPGHFSRSGGAKDSIVRFYLPSSPNYDRTG